MELGSIRCDWGGGCGAGTWEGRALRISLSSKSSRSEMLPSAGSDSLSLTSSMRACDIVRLVRLFDRQFWRSMVGLRLRWGVGLGNEA